MSEQEVLLESKQVKQLDSKFSQAHDKCYGFHDGDSWFEITVIDTTAIGAAKVR